MTKQWKRTGRFLRAAGGYFADEHVRPLTFWADLRRYDREKFRVDAQVALAVMLLTIPQSMAYATIAGLPILSGILCGALASIVGPLMCHSRQIILGPTNATALMLFSFFISRPDMAARAADLLPLLLLLVGVFALAGSVLRVADLLQYVSRSVLVGYISGAACLIIVNQMKHWLGVAGRIEDDKATTFVGLVYRLVKSLPLVEWTAVLAGAFTLAVFYGLRKWRPRWPVFALTLVVSCVVFGPLIHFKVPGFEALRTFETFRLEDFGLRLPEFIAVRFFGDLSELLPVAFAICFVGSLECSMMSKTLASRSSRQADLNQDIYGMGVTNLACALTGCMPVSCSPMRSILNFEAGAKSRFSSVISGMYTLVFALAIAWAAGAGFKALNHLPKASLAALVIALSFSLFHPKHLRICLRSTSDDAGVLVTTFACTLLAPSYVAVFVGVALSIALFLRKASRPHLVEYEFNDAGELREKGEKRQRPIPAISIVHVEGDLFFGAAELFRTQIQRTVTDPSIRVIILRMKNARHLDATSVMALEELIQFVRLNGLHLIISGASRNVYRVLKNSGVLKTLQDGCDRRAGESNLFLASPRNPNLSTRNALKRAQQLLGTKEADIRIFHDPSLKS